MKMKEEFDTVIVGAGASGLIAALEAAKGGGKVLLIERMDSPGRKILATGNGRCNMTNMNMNGDCYRGSGQALARYGISQMTPEKLRRYFYSLGLYTIERDGYVYPVTEQAKTVLRILNEALMKQGVIIHKGETVTNICPRKNEKNISREHDTDSYSSEAGFRRFAVRYDIETEQGSYRAPHVVLAAGGKASPNLGSNGSGYELAKKLGLKVNRPLPALTALTSPKGIFKALSGVRTKGGLSLFIDGTKAGFEKGEIQFTAYGVSGIPVFQLSRYAVEALEKKEKTELFFDFFPDLSFQELRTIVRDFRKETDCFSVLSGLVHEKWVSVLLKEAGISGNKGTVSEKKWNYLVSLLKEYPIPVDGYRDFDFAQACQGGVDASELTSNLESKKHKGLYLTGELVDVDGTCGGYNLHWAFTSGYLAGTAIAKQGMRENYKAPKKKKSNSRKVK